MRGTWSTRISFCVALLSALVLSPLARATNVTVDCNAKKNNSINAALALLSKQGPHTITVSGTCNEGVFINNFNNLTLITNAGATITDGIGVSLSDNIIVQGFTIPGGVGVSGDSFCQLQGNTIDSSPGAGVSSIRSSLFMSENIIQNSAGNGVSLDATNARIVGGTIQGNGQNGVRLVASTLRVDPGASANTAIQNNSAGGISADTNSSVRINGADILNNAGDGLTVADSSALLVGSASITNNGGHGVRVDRASVARFAGASTITTTAGNGVSIGDLSFASFAATVTISTGGALKVQCNPQFSATRGVANAASFPGETNCSEP